jgi:hypothetical protein
MQTLYEKCYKKLLSVIDFLLPEWLVVTNLLTLSVKERIVLE